VIAFTGLYMAIWLVASFVLRNDEFIFYFAVMCVLIVAVGVVHWQVRLHIGALWGLSLWGLAHMAGGYENTGWDLVANLVGCLIAAVAIFVLDKMRKY